LHFSEPNEDFLVSKAVKRASKAVQGSTKRQEGVRESRSDKLSSVGGNVASFMIAVDSDIQAHRLNEGLVIAKAKQRGKIMGVVFGRIDGRKLALTKDVTVNPSCILGSFAIPNCFVNKQE